MKSPLFCLPLMLASILSVSAAATAPPVQERTAKQWIEELSETYVAQEGYLARYESIGENKRLEITVGQDFKSGIGVSRMAATKNGAKFGNRIWCKGDRKVFVNADGRLIQMTIPDLPTPVVTLFEALNDSEVTISKSSALWLASFLSKDSIDVGFGFASELKPAWANLLKDAKVAAVDKASVTFSNAAMGRVQISRESGLMIRQEIAGADGVVRVITLIEHQAHPPAADLAAIYQDWDTAGAKPVPATEWNKLLLRMGLQEMINELATLEAPRAKLDDALKASEADFKAHFAAGFAAGEPMLIPDDKWQGLFRTEAAAMKTFWEQRAVELPGVTLDQFLHSKPVTAVVKQAVMTEFEKRPEFCEKITTLALGGPLEADDDIERAILDKLSKTLNAAYVDAMIDNRMKKFWPPEDKP